MVFLFLEIKLETPRADAILSYCEVNRKNLPHWFRNHANMNMNSDDVEEYSLLSAIA